MAAVRVVLAGPREGTNVGAVCRAMKTMGLEDLVIVGGGGIDLVRARVVAVHAADVLERAVWCERLEEALREVSLAAGVTRRVGSRRKAWSLTPEQLADRLAGPVAGTVALVFGNEEAGLSDEELAQCHLAVHIPSSPLFPSLNLSHAVQLVAYALFRRRLEAAGKPPDAPAPIDDERLGEVVQTIIGSLHAIGFMTQPGSRGLGAFWRDILARAQLSHREARRLEGMFRNLNGMFTRLGPSAEPPAGPPSP